MEHRACAVPSSRCLCMTPMGLAGAFAPNAMRIWACYRSSNIVDALGMRSAGPPFKLISTLQS